MRKMTLWTLAAVLTVAGAAVGGLADTILLDAPPATGPATAAALSDEAREILTTLQDRKATLRDFTAKVDYSVLHLDGDRGGKKGKVDYVNDAKGPRFSVDFSLDTFNGKPTHLHKSQIICDDKHVTLIDHQARQYDQSPSPGSNSLDSPIPLPIGIKVKDVIKDFNATVLPADAKNAADPNLVTLRLVPRMKGKFEYSKLDLTVDKKLQIPVKIVVYSTHKGEVTTIQFSEADINSGKAAILPTTCPGTVAGGWTINIKSPTTATAPK